MTRALGGALDWAALYGSSGRERHRPRSREELRAAVHELAQRGMGVDTIARATQLSVEQVRRMLREGVAA